MADQLDFAQAVKAIPELGSLNDRVEVVIIGYQNCPYSKKALAAKERHPRWKESGRVLFVSYDFGATGPFRQATLYRGSFPVVYVKRDGQFFHVGGGDDFDAYVSSRGRTLIL